MRPTSAAARIPSSVLLALPEFAGKPLELSAEDSLRVRGGRLRRDAGTGTAVHAASSIRRRYIVFETALLDDPPELARILIHELFHFVWVRLGNQRRLEYEAILRREWDAGTRGELGWSAQVRKEALRPADVAGRTRAWREYVCESFCDTAAWRYGSLDDHVEFTLNPRFHGRRTAWYRNFPGPGRRILI